MKLFFFFLANGFGFKGPIFNVTVQPHQCFNRGALINPVYTSLHYIVSNISLRRWRPKTELKESDWQTLLIEVKTHLHKV